MKSEQPNIGDVVAVVRTIEANSRPSVEFGRFYGHARGYYKMTLVQVLELSEQGNWPYMLVHEIGGNKVSIVWMNDVK